MQILKKSKEARIYSDFDLRFGIHPFTKDLNIKTNDLSIKQSLKNLILTRNYERPFHPEIGCQINSLLFEPFNDITSNVMRKTIFSAVEKFEPRIILNDVQISMDENNLNSLSVILDYTIKNNELPYVYAINLKRVR